jgi:uncharacterized protein GlcG (DUF336 family)
MDGAQIASIQISQGNAATLKLKLDAVRPLQAGLPIGEGSQVFGAIGVSGAASAQDEQCAQTGLDALSEN